MSIDYQIGLAIVSSLALAAAFIRINFKNPKLLKIDAHWLAISVLPILIVLFVNGYINKFEGFGLIIEGSLNKPIESKIDLAGTLVGIELKDAVKADLSKPKGNVSELAKIKNIEKITRLIFQNGYKNYSGRAIKKYLEVLVNVEYIEIVDAKNEFVGVILRKDIESIATRFADSLRNKSILLDFSKLIVTMSVTRETSAISTLVKMRDEGVSFIPFLSKDRHMVGVITESSLEKVIADKVLVAAKKLGGAR